MSTSALVLTLFIAWALFLLILMEVIRSYLVVTGQAKSNEYTPDNANFSAFLQRLARAHANCIENLPVVGGLLLVAIATGHTDVTDTLAPWLLLARFAQSITHLTSVSIRAINIRFCFFVVQLAIAAYWTWALLAR